MTTAAHIAWGQVTTRIQQHSDARSRAVRAEYDAWQAARRSEDEALRLVTTRPRQAWYSVTDDQVAANAAYEAARIATDTALEALHAAGAEWDRLHPLVQRTAP